VTARPEVVTAGTLARIAPFPKANHRQNRENHRGDIGLTRDDGTDSVIPMSTGSPSGILPPPKIAPAVRKHPGAWTTPTER